MVYCHKKEYPERTPIDRAKVKDPIAKNNSGSISIRTGAKCVSIHKWMMRDRIKQCVPALKKGGCTILPYESEQELHKKHVRKHTHAQSHTRMHTYMHTNTYRQTHKRVCRLPAGGVGCYTRV